MLIFEACSGEEQEKALEALSALNVISPVVFEIARNPPRIGYKPELRTCLNFEVPDGQVAINDIIRRRLRRKAIAMCVMPLDVEAENRAYSVAKQLLETNSKDRSLCGTLGILTLCGIGTSADENKARQLLESSDLKNMCKDFDSDNVSKMLQHLKKTSRDASCKVMKDSILNLKTIAGIDDHYNKKAAIFISEKMICKVDSKKTKVREDLGKFVCVEFDLNYTEEIALRYGTGIKIANNSLNFVGDKSLNWVKADTMGEPTDKEGCEEHLDLLIEGLMYDLVNSEEYLWRIGHMLQVYADLTETKLNCRAIERLEKLMNFTPSCRIARMCERIPRQF